MASHVLIHLCTTNFYRIWQAHIYINIYCKSPEVFGGRECEGREGGREGREGRGGGGEGGEKRSSRQTGLRERVADRYREAG